MKELNLLEKKDKEAIKLEIIISSIRSIISLLVLLVCLAAILISVANSLLTSQITQYLIESTPVKTQQKTINLELTQMTSLLNKVAAIQKNFWSSRKMLIEISQLVPAGNILSYLSIDKENKNVEIRGFAENRDDLMKFQKNLESSELFSKVTSPLSNLFKKEEINFQFQAQLK